MRRILYIGVLALCLAGCTHIQMPPFSTSGEWTAQGNSLINEKAKLELDFTESDDVPLPLRNATDGTEDLHFITSQAAFDAYDPACARYIKNVLWSIPMRIDSVEAIFADNIIVVRPNIWSQWRPDYYRLADGTEWCEQAWPLSNLVQPHDQVWLNVIISKKKHRLITVERFIKEGRHYALVRICQSSHKKAPWANWSLLDVTDNRNMMFIGSMLLERFRKSVKAWEKDYVLSYNDYIGRADDCYLKGDFAGASAAFEKAFATGGNVQGRDLYNAACVAALAGQPDVAFQRLNRRLAHDGDWYVSDPYHDSELASLYTDPRWQTYCDTITARRDRIEANYDNPLRQRLQRIAQSDQDIRYAYILALNASPCDQQVVDSLLREMVRIDSVNQVEICDILDTRGFVGKDKVGDACNVFWLVIQHSPLDLQRKYFHHFVDAMKRGDLPKSHIALMDDRIAMFEGRPQKYGSQLIMDDNGKQKLHTLLDPSMVDQWRQEMDLPPLADYLKSMGVEP